MVSAPARPGDGVRLALVAMLGAWAGEALTGSRWGAVAGAGGAVLLVTTEAGALLVAEARALVPALAGGGDPAAVPFPAAPAGRRADAGGWNDQNYTTSAREVPHGS